MRRIFLTSGLVLCLACPAFADIAAGTSSASCKESVLGSTTGPVDFASEWRPMISGTIKLDSQRYTSNDGSSVTPYTTNLSVPEALYAVYGVGVYDARPTVETLSNFTTDNRMTSLTSTPTRTGYNFSGFYTTKATGGTQVIAANGNIIYPDASTQVTTEGATSSWHARWTPNNYTVTYNAGLHGSGSDVSYTGAANGGLTYDATWTTKTFAQTGLSASSGYSFSKWNTAADGSGIDYTAGTAQSAWTTADNLTLYAVYTNAYPITYSCGSGSCGTPPSNGSANYGQSYNLSSTYGSCAKEGHYATGWDCSGGATLNNATGSQNANTWSSEETISCSVHWVANTVNLNYYQDANANSTFTTGTCTYGSTFNLPSTNLPTKPGYHINGWNIRGNGSASACADCKTLQSLDAGAYKGTNTYFAIGLADDSNVCFIGDSSGGNGDPSLCSNGEYADLTTYGWKVENNVDGYWLYGTSKCSAHSGDHFDTTWDTGGLDKWTATTSQLTSASGEAKYCWCKAVGYNTDGESSLCNTESPAWVFIEERGDETDCAKNCAQTCAEAVRTPDFDGFRKGLYGNYE